MSVDSLSAGQSTYDVSQLRFEHRVLESGGETTHSTRVEEESGSVDEMTPFPSVEIDNKLGEGSRLVRSTALHRTHLA